LTLELKILADVGLLGRPNAGKSTLLGAISAARPKVAAYPFTTLTPQLGVLRSKTNQQLIWADIPGLIPGAHQGQGLGYAFLRHVERTRLLVHILSVEECPLDRPEQGFVKLNEELAQYDRRLLARPQFWVLNKVDLLSADEQQVLKAKFARAGKEVFFISALTGEQVQGLVRAVWSFFESIWEAGGRGARN
jgi:GTP-binding protein